MEEKEQITTLEKTFSEMLKDIGFIGQRIKVRSDKLSIILKNSENVNNTFVEELGIEIVHILKMLKENSTASIKFLLQNINSINVNRAEKIFSKMQSMLESISNNEDDEICPQAEMELGDSSKDSAPSNTAETSANKNCNGGVTLKNVDIPIGLSLRRQNTIDTIYTEDSWKDTLQRTKQTDNCDSENEELFEIDSKNEQQNSKEKCDASTSGEYSVTSRQSPCGDNMTEFAKDLGETDNNVKIISGSDPKQLSKESLVNNVESTNLDQGVNKMSDSGSCISDSDDNVYSVQTQKIYRKKRHLRTISDSSSGIDSAFGELFVNNGESKKQKKEKTSDKNVDQEDDNDNYKIDTDDSSISNEVHTPELIIEESSTSGKINNRSGEDVIDSQSKAIDLKEADEVDELLLLEECFQKTDSSRKESQQQENAQLSCETVAVENVESLTNNLEDISHNSEKDGAASETDSYQDPFSVETVKISSDEEISTKQQTSDLYNEHSYSCASASDLEDSTKCADPNQTERIINEVPSDDDKSISETEKIDSSTKVVAETGGDTVDDDSDTNNIFNEHNYSSAGSPVAESSLDSDGTDTEKDKSCLPQEQCDVDDSSQVSTATEKSYEFDISNYPDNTDESNSKKHSNTQEESVELVVAELNDQLENHEQDEGNSKKYNNTQEESVELVVEELNDQLENHEQENNSSETILYYEEKPDIKVEKDCEIKIDVEETQMCKQEEKLEDINKTLEDIGDELLELLKSVPKCPIDDFPIPSREVDENSAGAVDENAAGAVDEIAEVNTAIRELLEDESDMSDSNNSSFSDSSLSTIKAFDILDSDDDETKALLKKYNMQKCSVRLTRMHFPEETLRKFAKNLEYDIDWLCDLDNLENKKRCSSPTPFGARYTKKRRKKYSSDSSSIIYSSSCEDSVGDGNDSGSDKSNRNSDQTRRLDELLADALCNVDDGESDMDNTDSDDSDTSDNRKKKRKSKTGENGDENGLKEPLTKEEMEKKAWKNDPLLHGRLSSDSDSDKSKKRRRKGSRRYEDDTEFSISSEHLSSDSESENVRAKNQSKLEKNKISPIKGNLPHSDSTDTDSDVQYVSPIKNLSQNDPDTPSPLSQKGRRNIRSLVSDKFLAEETKKANKEEQERIERLKDRHKVLETFSQSSHFSQQISTATSENEVIPPFVLDVDEKTGEPLVEVHPAITKKLKPHQRTGIQFMWDSCYESLKRIKNHPGSGCILAHCMGLGKTLQVLALVHTLLTYDESDAKHVLIVCPLSTVVNWKNELKFAFSGIPEDKKFSLFVFPNGKDVHFRYDVVQEWWRRKKAMLVVGYESFENVTNENKLDKTGDLHLKKRILEALVDPGPDLVICDEGHLIKNKKAVRTVALHKIRTKRRIVLTGTPLQNNLMEYYHMVHFVKPNLLGTVKEFKTNFVNPITNGQYEDSTQLDIKLMRSRTHVLHKILSKTVQRVEDTELELYIPKMVDHAVFIQLHQVQCELYNTFSNLVRNRTHKMGKRFLSDFDTLQYLCTHPSLLSLMEKPKNKIKEQDVICEDDEPVFNTNKDWWKDKIPSDALDKIEYGHKLVVLKGIIEECEAVGDKLLVFSQKLAELDLIENFLKKVGTKNCPSWRKQIDYFRMDGTVPPDVRAGICDTFNNINKKEVRLLLMSTKVGGLGLNLTAANRVVIMTVHWNPSYDTQSVFRVYRFGQTKQVYVYRLISLDTMEQKVYQRSVTKLAIAHRVVDKHQIDRHYKSVDLQELYSCRPTSDNERPAPSLPKDEMLAKLILKLPCIYTYHEHKALLVDRQEDKLTEQEMAAAWEEFKNKDIPKPAPPPAVNLIKNGPTFEQAYNLSRFNLNEASTSHQQYIRPQFDVQTKQYYIPNHNHPSVNQDSTGVLQRNPITIHNQASSNGTLDASSAIPTNNNALLKPVNSKNYPTTQFPRGNIYTDRPISYVTMRNHNYSRTTSKPPQSDAANKTKNSITISKPQFDEFVAKALNSGNNNRNKTPSASASNSDETSLLNPATVFGSLKAITNNAASNPKNKINATINKRYLNVTTNNTRKITGNESFNLMNGDSSRGETGGDRNANMKTVQPPTVYKRLVVPTDLEKLIKQKTVTKRRVAHNVNVVHNPFQIGTTKRINDDDVTANKKLKINPVSNINGASSSHARNSPKSGQQERIVDQIDLIDGDNTTTKQISKDLSARGISLIKLADKENDGVSVVHK